MNRHKFITRERYDAACAKLDDHTMQGGSKLEAREVLELGSIIERYEEQERHAVEAHAKGKVAPPLKETIAEFLLDMREIRDAVKDLRASEWLEPATAETMDDAIAYLQETVNLADLHLAEIVNEELVKEGKIKAGHKYERAVFKVYGLRNVPVGFECHEAARMRTVIGYVRGGLGVADKGKEWLVYHIESGRPFGTCIIESKNLAIAIADKAIASGIDWTLPLESLCATGHVYLYNGSIFRH